MKDGDLDQALDRMKRDLVPGTPGNLSSRVWRSIREAEARASREWIPSFWPAWILRPAFAIALVTATFGAGVMLGSGGPGEGPWMAPADNQAMALDAFELSGPGSPYGRLFNRQ